MVKVLRIVWFVFAVGVILSSGFLIDMYARNAQGDPLLEFLLLPLIGLGVFAFFTLHHYVRKLAFKLDKKESEDEQ